MINNPCHGCKCIRSLTDLIDSNEMCNPKNLKPGTLIIIISNFAFHYILYTLEIFAGSVPKVMQNISNFKGRLNPQFQKKNQPMLKIPVFCTLITFMKGMKAQIDWH